MLNELVITYFHAILQLIRYTCFRETDIRKKMIQQDASAVLTVPPRKAMQLTSNWELGKTFCQTPLKTSPPLPEKGQFSKPWP